MDTPESAQKAVELAGQEVMERPISIEIARGKGTTSSTGASHSEPSNTLFMGNLSFQIDEETVRGVFGEFGEVIGVRWGEDKETGKFRGFGWIEFADVEGAKAAFEAKNGSDVMERPIKLDFATPSRNPGGGNRPPRGGGFGGGRGGGRGGFGSPRGSPRGGFGGGRGGPRGGGRGGFGASPRGGRPQAAPFAGKKTTFDE